LPAPPDSAESKQHLANHAGVPKDQQKIVPAIPEMRYSAFLCAEIAHRHRQVDWPQAFPKQSHGDHGIETIVAVRHPKPGEPGKIAVVSPCGICRELIHDYDAGARVIVPDNGRVPKVVSIGELLPNKYKRGSE